MVNRRMLEKVKSGECIDIGRNRKTSEGYYLLEKFVDNIDYCDTTTESWIWSIGKHRETGIIVASTDSIFYQNPQFECLFLR